MNNTMIWWLLITVNSVIPTIFLLIGIKLGYNLAKWQKPTIKSVEKEKEAEPSVVKLSDEMLYERELKEAIERMPPMTDMGGVEEYKPEEEGEK